MSGAAINCPITGSFTVNGSGQLEIVTMHTVSLSEADATFDVSADAFQYFSGVQEAPGSSSATFTVNLDASGLEGALTNWIKGDATLAGVEPESWMLEQLRADINAAINLDGVGSALEGSVVKNLAFAEGAGSFDVNATAAVTTLVTELNASQEAKDLIGLQFPAARYPDGASNGTFAIPAQVGDSLTFQFTITSTITVTEDRVDDSTTQANASNASPVSPVMPNLTALRSRIIHIKANKTA
jgi:hypothetical protein